MQEIPKSNIKGTYIHADLNHPKGKGTLLFLDEECSVIGLNNLPYMLFLTPKFNKNDLPQNVKKDIYEVKELVLQSTFSINDRKSVKYCTIPKWVTDFKKIEYLRLEYVEINDLDDLKDLPIQHLIFENIKYNDSKKVVAAIKHFKNLKEISFDQSLSTSLIDSIKGLNVKLSPLAQE